MTQTWKSWHGTPVNTWKDGIRDSMQNRMFQSRALEGKKLCLLAEENCVGVPRRNVPDFGRVFLMLKNADITQNTYAQS
jgi:hypothetical protein